MARSFTKGRPVLILAAEATTPIFHEIDYTNGAKFRTNRSVCRTDSYNGGVEIPLDLLNPKKVQPCKRCLMYRRHTT